jgi:hypothetical protein
MIKKYYILIIMVVLILIGSIIFPYLRQPKKDLISNEKLTPVTTVKEDIPAPIKKEKDATIPPKNQEDQWAEISKKIAIVEEEINSDNFSSLEGLKELLAKNEAYPRKKEVEGAIKNWEQEKTWSVISKQLVGLEKELNAGNFKSLETVKDLMVKNPSYPMRVHIEESIKRWEQAIVWQQLTKELEMMAYMLDKGIFKDLEKIRDVILKNPEYPNKKHFDNKIKKWDHEYFLINVPL